MVANKDFQQAVNKALILRTVLTEEESTRASLARELGMYRSTVSNITEVLLEEGWLVERGTANAAGAGRKGTILSINPSHGLIAGIAIRRRGRYEIVFMDPTGAELSSLEDRGPAKDLPALVSAVLERAEAEARQLSIRLLGAGLSLSGPVDNTRQRIVWSEQFGLRDVDFLPIAGDRPYPVVVENDSQSCTWGKAWQSGNTGGEDFAYLYLNRQSRVLTPDIAFGLGIFLNGQAYHGAHRYAGEFPSKYVRDIDAKFRGREVEFLKNPLNPKKAATPFVTEAADGLLDMIQFLDPHKFYLGHFLEPYKEMIDSYIDSRKEHILFDVEYAGLGPFESAYGAGCYLLNRIYAVPVAGPGAS